MVVGGGEEISVQACTASTLQKLTPCVGAILRGRCKINASQFSLITHGLHLDDGFIYVW